jgi:polysaccharide export outer membrane protein
MIMRLRALSFLIIVVLGSAAAAQTPAMRQSATLQPGDEVRIRVFRDSEMSGEFGIGPDGALLHPVWRNLKVTGIPLSDVETRIRTFLQRYQTEPQFVAEPLFRVTVGGEVERPALYFFSPDVTIGQAIAIAGGATERGKHDQVRLLSGGQLRAVKLDGNDPAANLPVRSGDQLIIAKRGSLFRDVLAPLFAVAGSAAAIINVTRNH